MDQQANAPKRRKTVHAHAVAPMQATAHKAPFDAEHPIASAVYPAIDNDLARDNIENDLPEADREDLWSGMV